jgi:CheY-like chemotaxis protein
VFSSQSRAVILVVEDDPMLRMNAVEMVEAAGYIAVEAQHAADAVRILEARLDIRVVFTDIDMPGSMDGLKLAACIRDRWPPIKVIVTSGHRTPHKNEIPAETVFFAKPYSERAVVRAMNEMMEQ